MRYLLAVLLFVLTLTTCRTGRAETWQEFVRARAAEGMDDMQIRKALVRAPVVTNTLTVIQAKDPVTVAWERAALAEVESFLETVTGSRSNALARVGGLSVQQIVAIVRQAKVGADAAKRAEIADKSDALTVLFIGAKEKGYSWPLPADFGQDTRTVTVERVRAGRARWETLKPVGWQGDPPSLGQVRDVLAGGDGVGP